MIGTSCSTTWPNIAESDDRSSRCANSWPTRLTASWRDRLSLRRMPTNWVHGRSYAPPALASDPQRWRLMVSRANDLPGHGFEVLGLVIAGE